MKKITILHPFTPKAAGAVEKSVPTYHSQPHLKAMQMLESEFGYKCEMEYFTSNLFSYKKKIENILYKFYPVTRTINGDSKKWKKQESKACFTAYKKQIPDVTIINMSGHSSSFSHKLAKLIMNKNKQYIAMLGGQHYSDTKENREYYVHANHILVHTHMQKRDMEMLLLFEGCDIRVFPLGVNCEVFKPLNRELNNLEPQLLYVGRIIEWKRIHLAIQALKHLHLSGFTQANLNIIGPTVSDAYLVQLKILINDLELEEWVEFLGHKEHDELPEYFQKADLFMLPSDKETFGMVMIEAMACGTPVAGMDCPGGPADVISHNMDGILTSLEDYNDAVLAFFKNGDIRKQISSNARNKALDSYSIQATYSVLKESIEDALK